MSTVPDRASTPTRFRTPLIAALSVSLIGSAALLGSPTASAAPVVAENGWSYETESFDTGITNGYQLALDAKNRKVYLSDAAWSKQTRTVTDNGDGTYTYGPDEFTVGSGKLSVFDSSSRAREDDHSFLGLTRNDGNGRENEPFSWANAQPDAASINSMRTTFSPYGVAVDGTTPGGATIVTTTARQRDGEAGYGGGVVVYKASQGAPTDADRLFAFEDGSPIFNGVRRIAVNTKTHKAYVTNLGNSRGSGSDGFIAQIDLVTKQVDARITVPNALGAVGVAVDEGNNLIYIGTMLAGKQYVIDGAKVNTSDPKDLALNNDAVTELKAELGANQRPTYSPELKRLYVSSFDTKTIHVIDADPASAGYGTVLKNIETGPTNAVEVDGQRNLLYSANLGDKNVVVYNAKTYQKLLTLPTSGNAINIGIDPVSRDVWVSNFSNAGKVDVFTVTAPEPVDGWSYEGASVDTDIRNGYQLAFDSVNRKVYLSDAAWSSQTRTVTDNGDGTYTYGDTEFTVGNGKLAVVDSATRAREADQSFLGLTRNDGDGRENEPMSWSNAAADAKSMSAMRSTFSPYGVAVDGTTPGGPTLITTTARQRDAAAGYGGGVVVYNASQGAPTDADRIYAFEDGTPIFSGVRRIAVNTKTHKAYVTNLGNSRGSGPDGFIAQIDLLTKKVEARITVPNALGAVGVAVDEDNNLIYIGTMLAGKQYVIDGAKVKTTDAKDLTLNNDAVTELDAEMGSNQRPTYNSELKRLYVSSFDTKTIHVIDADPASANYGKLLKSIETGPTNSVEVDAERGLLFSANLGDKNVVVFDTNTYEKVLTLPTSGNAVNIGIDPVTRDVWVSNFSNAGKVDVFTITAGTNHETTSPDGATLITPRQVVVGSDITISGKGFFLKNGDGGSIGPVFVNQGGGTQGTGPVNVAGRTIENQSEVTFNDARAHGVFKSDAEGNWTITIPFPTPENSTLTSATAWKPGDVQYIRVLTGSLVPENADQSRSIAAPFTVVADPDAEPEPGGDKAEATVASEWVEGKPLTISGTGWTWEDGTGSTIGVKLNRGTTSLKDDPYADIADNIWGWIKADDTTGNWTLELPYPSAAIANNPVKVGDDVTIHLLTGGLAPGDRIRSVPKTVKVVADPDAPVVDKPFTSASTPTISGTPDVGKTLKASVKAWNPTVTLKYQWLRDGKAISGATKSSYKLTKSDAGKKVSVKVTGSKTGYETTSKTSKAVTVKKQLTSTSTPTISGTKKVGKTLKASVKAWAPAKVTLKYQWLRDGKAISKATKSSYKLTKSDAGKKISVKVTGSKSGYTSVSKTSKTVTVAKVKSTVKVTSLKSVKKGKKATLKVTISTATSKPTGKVTVTVNGKKVTKTVKTSAKGKVSITLPAISKKGSYKVKASFTPSGSTAKSTSKSSTVTKTLKVT